MRKDITSLLALSVVFVMVYALVEPVLTKAAEDEISVTQHVSSEISISPDDSTINMSADIPGSTGNHSSPTTGQVVWTIKTTNAQGFTMAVKASAAPAMVLDGTYHFDDYGPGTPGTPDYDWTSPSSGEAEFGYTVEPETAADSVQLFKNDGDSCNEAAGTQSDGHCWYNFTASNVQVISRGSATDSGGEAETVKFQAESYAKYLKEGDYVATITATVAEI